MADMKLGELVFTCSTTRSLSARSETTPNLPTVSTVRPGGDPLKPFNRAASQERVLSVFGFIRLHLNGRAPDGSAEHCFVSLVALHPTVSLSHLPLHSE